MKVPRFSIRELFLLVVIAAMGCGWWVERRRLTEFGNLWRSRAEKLKGLVEGQRKLMGKAPDIEVNWEPNGDVYLSFPKP